MSYDIIAIPNFKRELKKLAKKFPSLKNDFGQLLGELEENPKKGILLSNNCYKIKMAIKSKGRGKSGGSRVITHLQVSQTKVYLLSIYDKSDRESISDKEIRELLKYVPE